MQYTFSSELTADINVLVWNNERAPLISFNLFQILQLQASSVGNTSRTGVLGSLWLVFMGISLQLKVFTDWSHLRRWQLSLSTNRLHFTSFADWCQRWVCQQSHDEKLCWFVQTWCEVKFQKYLLYFGRFISIHEVWSGEICSVQGFEDGYASNTLIAALSIFYYFILLFYFISWVFGHSCW